MKQDKWETHLFPLLKIQNICCFECFFIFIFLIAMCTLTVTQLEKQKENTDKHFTRLAFSDSTGIMEWKVCFECPGILHSAVLTSNVNTFKREHYVEVQLAQELHRNTSHFRICAVYYTLLGFEGFPKRENMVENATSNFNLIHFLQGLYLLSCVSEGDWEVRTCACESSYE